jgi:hypothetical protein
MVTKELLQGVVEEEVRYYAISLERSQVNELYEEAIRKVWSPPVAIDALVLWGQDATRVARFDLDAQYTLEVYFHKKELEERNVKVHEGDFVEYDGKFFEISSATEPQIVFGQVNNKVMVKCTCVVSREGQFAAGADNTRSIRTEKNIENRPGVPQVNRISVDPTPAFNRFRLYPTGSVG